MAVSGYSAPRLPGASLPRTGLSQSLGNLKQRLENKEQRRQKQKEILVEAQLRMDRDRALADYFNNATETDHTALTEGARAAVAPILEAARTQGFEEIATEAEAGAESFIFRATKSERERKKKEMRERPGQEFNAYKAHFESGRANLARDAASSDPDTVNAAVSDLLSGVTFLEKAAGLIQDPGKQEEEIKNIRRDTAADMFQAQLTRAVNAVVDGTNPKAILQLGSKMRHGKDWLTENKQYKPSRWLDSEYVRDEIHTALGQAKKRRDIIDEQRQAGIEYRKAQRMTAEGEWLEYMDQRNEDGSPRTLDQGKSWLAGDVRTAGPENATWRIDMLGTLKTQRANERALDDETTGTGLRIFDAIDSKVEAPKSVFDLYEARNELVNNKNEFRDKEYQAKLTILNGKISRFEADQSRVAKAETAFRRDVMGPVFAGLKATLDNRGILAGWGDDFDHDRFAAAKRMGVQAMNVAASRGDLDGPEKGRWERFVANMAVKLDASPDPEAIAKAEGEFGVLMDAMIAGGDFADMTDEQFSVMFQVDLPTQAFDDKGAVDLESAAAHYMGKGGDWRTDMAHLMLTLDTAREMRNTRSIIDMKKRFEELDR